MKDTDIIRLELDITVMQARYLKNKCHQSSRENRIRFARTRDEEYYKNEVMWEGLAEILRVKLKEIDIKC